MYGSALAVKAIKIMVTRLNRHCGALSGIPLALVATCFLLGGCGRSIETIWSTKSASPDGKWTATGRADRHSGPGNAAIEMGVYLSPANGSSGEQTMLMFLNDLPPDNGGVTFSLKWVTPTHLEINLSRLPNIDFQVVKYAGIDISIQAPTIGTSH